MYEIMAFSRACASRSPHGERGLKSENSNTVIAMDRSLSSWRAWIEILKSRTDMQDLRVALLMESVD